MNAYGPIVLLHDIAWVNQASLTMGRQTLVESLYYHIPGMEMLNSAPSIQRWIRENKNLQQNPPGVKQKLDAGTLQNWAGVTIGLTGFCQTPYDSDSSFWVPTGAGIIIIGLTGFCQTPFNIDSASVGSCRRPSSKFFQFLNCKLGRWTDRLLPDST